MGLNEYSNFRAWVHNLWIENCREREAYGDTDGCADSREYFNKFKWWLKREYKYQHPHKK